MKNTHELRLDPCCELAIAAHRRYRRDYPLTYCQQPDCRRTTYDPATGVVTLRTRNRVLALYRLNEGGWLYEYPTPPKGSRSYRYQKMKRCWQKERRWQEEVGREG
jgi:hypothetical protein